MKKGLFIGLALVIALAVLLPAPALAAKPVLFNASGIVAVTSISTPIPAGYSGRVRIEMETSASIAPVSGDPPLAGTILFMQQKSNELFSSPDFTTMVAIDGSSVGTFKVVDPVSGAELVTGRYHLNVSNVPGCQIYDQGTWSTTGSGQFKGRGTVTACMNFNPSYGTFVGQVTFSGTVN